MDGENESHGGHTQAPGLKEAWMYVVAEAILWPVYIELFFLYFSWLKGTTSLLLLLFTSFSVIPLVVFLRAVRGLFNSKSDLSHQKWWVITGVSLIALAVFLWNLWQLIGPISDVTSPYWASAVVNYVENLFNPLLDVLLVLSAAVAIPAVPAVVDRRLKKTGRSIARIWKAKTKHQRAFLVGFVVMVIIVLDGATVVYAGYSELSSPPNYYVPYPYYPQARPQYSNYTVRLGNLTVQVNASQWTLSPAFVVGDDINAQVLLKVVNVSASYPDPVLRKLTFPNPDNWSFYYYASGDYYRGDEFAVSGYRVYPSPGTYRLVDNWTLTTGLWANETFPVYLNLTLFGRDAIASYQNAQQQALQVDLQLFVEQRQEAYNLILVGFSLVFGASLVPEGAKLISAWIEPGDTERSSENPRAPPT